MNQPAAAVAVPERPVATAINRNYLGDEEQIVRELADGLSPELERALARLSTAEREVVALSREEPVGAQVIPYLNRLSDALFVLARWENRERGIPEPLWDSRR